MTNYKLMMLLICSKNKKKLKKTLNKNRISVKKSKYC